jgi:alanine racemase
LFLSYNITNKTNKMNNKSKAGLRTWIEVDKKAVTANYRLFRSLLSKKCRLMAVVKSNAYGHGLVPFSQEMEKLGADFLGVDSAVEAMTLRKHGIKIPILILGYTLKEMLSEAARNDASITVSNFTTLAALAGVKTGPVKIHIKVDSGMRRQGFSLADIPKVLAALKKLGKKIAVEGLYTHFAAAKNPAFPKDTEAQAENFKTWVKAFGKAGFTPLAHVGATAGAVLFPEYHFDMVRVGIGLYGLWPAKEIREYFRGRITLEPVLTWKTIVGEVKKIPRGSRIGYDFTERLIRDTTTAICPVGYWHGFPRALSSIGGVLVGGREARVLGRVSMDMIAVDVTGIPRVAVEDEVVLIGRQGKAEISAERVGDISDSSWYEIVTRLNPLVRRIYL